MTGSNILILLRFYVFGLTYSFGKNYRRTGSSFVIGLLFCEVVFPLITGVFGPFDESGVLGRVLS
jgi:hypothetical protein